MVHSDGMLAGMLLRFFMNMYDLEIVEEEAFFRWKEEVNDQYAGKGKALFQVNTVCDFDLMLSDTHPGLLRFLVLLL